MWIAAAAACALSGCVSLSSMESATTLGVGHWQLAAQPAIQGGSGTCTGCELEIRTLRALEPHLKSHFTARCRSCSECASRVAPSSCWVRGFSTGSSFLSDTPPARAEGSLHGVLAQAGLAIQWTH